MSSWAARAAEALAPLVGPVRALLAAGDLKAARRMVKDAYPFGLREHHPYKTWCKVVKRVFPGLYPKRNALPDPAGQPRLLGD